MSDWYQTTIVAAGRAPALWLLVGFVLTYGTTRWVTLRIHARRESGAGDGNSRIKDLHIGGVHVHHQVWGILLVLLSGLLEFRFRPGSPWVEVLSVLFGVGAALALDEFALWLHLEDVYWSEEGRKSIDAVMLAAVVGLVLLVGSSPIGVDRETVAASGRLGYRRGHRRPHRLHDHLPAQGQDRHGPHRPTHSPPRPRRRRPTGAAVLVLGPSLLCRAEDGLRCEETPAHPPAARPTSGSALGHAVKPDVATWRTETRMPVPCLPLGSVTPRFGELGDPRTWSVVGTVGLTARRTRDHPGMPVSVNFQRAVPPAQLARS